MLHRVLVLTCLLGVTCFLGCGGGAGGTQPTFSLKGKLFVDDKPFGPATLTFSSTAADGKGESMSGNVAQDGTITFVAQGQEGKATAGNYNVVMAGDIMTMKTVPATNPVTIDIKSGDKDVEIKLTSIPGAAPVGGLAAPNLAQ